MSSGRSTTSIKPIISSVVVRSPLPQNLPRSNIHLINNAAKSHLFRHEIPFTAYKKARSRTILKKLESLSPLTASRLDLKSDDIHDLRFRLYGDLNQCPAQDLYIALSYLWSEFSRTFRNLPGYSLDIPVPTSSAIFQAVLNERKSQNEGLWVDQICINQDDDADKAVSIAAMDTVYKSARVVVIALDDVIITDDEAKALEGSADAARFSELRTDSDLLNRYLENNMVSNRISTLKLFHHAVKKVVESQYFERAWCHHELRLGLDHIFLVPMLDYKDSGRVDHSFIRFNGAFLYHAVLLHANDSPSTPKLEKIKRDLHSIFLKSGSTEHFDRPNVKVVVQHQSDAFHSYTHSIAEVFDSKAGGNPLLPTKELRDLDANVDKMSIILNAVDSGLILRRSLNTPSSNQAWTLKQCQQQMMLVALAAGDPVVLCTTGPPLELQNETFSWLCWPHSGDIDIGHFSPISPLSVDAPVFVDQSADSKFIELDLLFIHSITSRSCTTDPSLLPYLYHAQDFLTKCINNNIGGGQSLPWNSWHKEGDTERTPRRDLFTQTLAAILSCGRQWIIQVSSSLGMNHTELSLALSHFFPTITTTTISTTTTFFEPCGNNNNNNNWRTTTTLHDQKSAKHILDFLHTVIGKNLELLPSTSSSSSSSLQPILFAAATAAGPAEQQQPQPCLAFVPSSSSLVSSSLVSPPPLHLAIPAVLTSQDYHFLSRCWLLLSSSSSSSSSSSILHDQDDGVSKWRMVGKSRIFGAAGSFSTHRNINASHILRKQRVYGPERGWQS